jgi:hypothetical protein
MGSRIYRRPSSDIRLSLVLEHVRTGNNQNASRCQNNNRTRLFYLLCLFTVSSDGGETGAAIDGGRSDHLQDEQPVHVSVLLSSTLSSSMSHIGFLYIVMMCEYRNIFSNTKV